MLQSLLPSLVWKDPTVDASWDDAVSRHPAGTAFHTAGWAKVLMSTYGQKPFYGMGEGSDFDCPLIPMMEVRSWLSGCRGVSLPFTDFCSPLGGTDATNFASLCELGRARGWQRIEMRGSGVIPDDAKPSAEYLGHELDLRPGLDCVVQGYTRAARAGTRKAKDSGVVASISASSAAMHQYYALHARTRRRHGAPPQPWGFFENLQHHVMERGLGFTVLARICNVPVAGAVFLCSGTRAVYKYGAADLSAQAFRPSNLVMATAISHLVDLGMESLHFGRTAPENEGLRFFKAGWGAQEERIRYYLYDLTTKRWLNGPDRVPRFCTALFRRLPLTLNRAIGSLLYPHLD